MAVTHLPWIHSLDAIAQNPMETVSQFKSITPTHQVKIRINYDKLITAFVVGMISLATLRVSKVGVVFLPGVCILLYRSIKTESVETEAFKKQVDDIKKLFDPCINGVLNERNAKIKVIKDTIHDKPKQNSIEVKQAIESVASIYDGKKDSTFYPDALIGKRVMDQDSYDVFTQAAQKLGSHDVNSFDHLPDIASLAIEKFKDLHAVCKLFVQGRNDGVNLQYDAYVAYGLWNGKALILDE